MRSAYFEAMQREPKFTNYAKTAGMDFTFAHTIDFIFFNDGARFKGKTARLAVRNVLPLDDVCDAIANSCVSLPNDSEPSDHLLIAAEFELSVEQKADKAV